MLLRQKRMRRGWKKKTRDFFVAIFFMASYTLLIGSSAPACYTKYFLKEFLVISLNCTNSPHYSNIGVRSRKSAGKKLWCHVRALRNKP